MNRKRNRDYNSYNHTPKKRKKDKSKRALNKKKLNIKSINELHDEARKKFNELENIKNVNYKTILENVLNIYDLDENINEIFLKQLQKYYLDNKYIVDNSNNLSDTIAKLFFKFIFTLSHEKRIEIFKIYNYFQKNELFLETDKKYFIKEPLNKVFKNFITDILSISLTIKEENQIKSSQDYLKDLQNIFDKYQFPDASYKIPVKYGNDELMYINFIIKFQLFLTFQTGDNIYQNRFFNYDIKTRFLALNFFSDYLESNQYDKLNLLYIIFCLFSFFMYYDMDNQTLEPILNVNMFSCSRFMFQKFSEKKAYLKKIKQYIKSEIDFDNIPENYFDKNILKLEYEGKEFDINVNDCYFLENDKDFIFELINGKAYNFEFLKRKQFPLSFDDSLNKDFESHIKKCLQSKLTNEYIKCLKDIPNFDGIVFNDKIIDEIKSNTLWVKFPLSKVHGLSDRDTYTIFLNNNIDGINDKKSCNIISSKTITCGHEYDNHILRLILSINNFNIEKTTHRTKDVYKNKEYNKLFTKNFDQGDIWENIIFGEKINYIFIGGSLFILDTNNLNLSINQFKEGFQKNNRRCSIKDMKKKLKELKKNKNNTLIQHIKDFDTNDKDFWLKNEQFIIARTCSNFINCQSIPFGSCGTRGFNILP